MKMESGASPCLTICQDFPLSMVDRRHASCPTAQPFAEEGAKLRPVRGAAQGDGMRDQAEPSDEERKMAPRSPTAKRESPSLAASSRRALLAEST
jgi:hypothetical protein